MRLGISRRLKLRAWPPAKTILLFGLTLLFFAGGTLVLWVMSLPLPDFQSFDQRLVTESTKIYDRTGKILLYDVHDNIRRTRVPLEDISPYLQKATLAIEDAHFYEHHGVRPFSIIRAFIANFTSGSLRQGGSTITQQVIKNSLLTRDKKISRKFKEIFLALKLEQVKSKDEILAIYLNEIAYGGSLYGIEEAAQAFFHKNAKELTLTEAAYLAAIPKAPTFYSPYGNHREELERRKNLVVARMLELELISPAEAAASAKERIAFAPPEDRGIKAPHFVFLIKDYLEKRYGEGAVENRGLKVITTLDWELQKRAETIVAKFAESNVQNFKATNASLVAIDPATGQILVLVGSHDYFDTKHDGNFNIALAHRQPGSAFKPFVYATAFNKGYTPETAIFDLPTQFSTNCDAAGVPVIPGVDPETCYQPVNYDGKFRGPLTFRTALAQSINIPAIKVLYLAGIKESLATARAMGISSLTDPNRYGLTLVLGGGEVSLLEMTSAYGVFANDGVKNSPQSIMEVRDAGGNVLEKITPKSSPVLPPNTARLISNILSDDEARLHNPLLVFPGRDVAAKTGTTNDYRDAWIIGYTPNLAVGAWAGNNDNSPMEKKIAGFIVAPMWSQFLKEALSAIPDQKFIPPEKSLATDLQPVFRGFWQGGESYWLDKVSGKRATAYTPAELRAEHVLTNVHSILYWVDKNNPLGPRPTQPEDDPQFNLWETPVREWAESQSLAEEFAANLPTATDDVHKPEYAPRVTIITPAAGAHFDLTTPITVTLTINSKFPISQADFFVNGRLFNSLTAAPFTTTFTSEQVANLGTTNELRVVVYDSVKNRTEATANFFVGSSPNE